MAGSDVPVTDFIASNGMVVRPQGDYFTVGDWSFDFVDESNPEYIRKSIATWQAWLEFVEATRATP